MSKQGFSVAFVLGIMLLSGCSPNPIGKDISSIYSTGFVCFACSYIEHTERPFGQTRIIPGIVIREGSLMQNQADLTNSPRTSFVLIKNRFLGGLVAGEYWVKQSKSNAVPGDPMMDTRPSKIVLVEVDERKAITNFQVLKIAYIEIAVDPADFGRPFTEYVGHY